MQLCQNHNLKIVSSSLSSEERGTQSPISSSLRCNEEMLDDFEQDNFEENQDLSELSTGAEEAEATLVTKCKPKLT